MARFLATKPSKFIVGHDRAEFYIHRGFVSRLSTPLNALVNNSMEESLEGCIAWEDVDADVFSRFAQFLYTGTYLSFAPAGNENRNENTSGQSEEASTTVSNTDRGNPTFSAGATTEPTSLFGNSGFGNSGFGGSGFGAFGNSGFGSSATTEPASLFGNSLPSEAIWKVNNTDPFKLPYSLSSYERAAAERANGVHAAQCKFNKPSSRGSKRKTDAVACHCSPSGGTFERKRYSISAFLTKQGDNICRSAHCQDIWQIKPVTPTKIFEHVFVGHVKIWALATRYSIDSLADLSCAKLAHDLAHWTISESAFITEFGGLVRYVYSDRTTAGCQLERLVAEFAACVVEDVCGLEGWSALLNEVPDFAADLIKQMTVRMG